MSVKPGEVHDLKAINEIVSGKGKFGPLINSTMDLDNIDNVFRLAYHIGIVKSGEVPLKLAKSLYTENGKLKVRTDALPFIKEWYKVRKKLYSLLLLNPEEFSAKCMLTEAIELAKIKDIHPFNWYNVDYEIIKKLYKCSSDIAIIISRLMKGDLYGCVGIFSTGNTDKYNNFINTSKRREFENDLTKLIRLNFPSRYKSTMVSLHVIVDVNKTERQVLIQTDDNRMGQIGTPSNRLLIGVFFKNKDLNMYKIPDNNTIRKMRQEISKFLSNILEDQNLQEVELYKEIKELEYENGSL